MTDGDTDRSPVINLDRVELRPLPSTMAAPGKATERYAPKVAMVGLQLGATKLGYNVIALPPGKRGFPFHNHRENEEMFFILNGTGEIRIGDKTHPVRSGDIIACPAGGPETAHQIINTGTIDLCYLALSTKCSPDIIEYPDSGKFRVISDHAVDADGAPQHFDVIGRVSESLGYWDGE